MKYHYRKNDRKTQDGNNESGVNYKLLGSAVSIKAVFIIHKTTSCVYQIQICVYGAIRGYPREITPGVPMGR